MINHRIIWSIFTLCIISLFVVVVVDNFLFEQGDLSGNVFDFELGENLVEFDESDSTEESFTGFGGNNFFDCKKTKYRVQKFKTLLRQALNSQAKCYSSHSLVILYCCLKIVFD